MRLHPGWPFRLRSTTRSLSFSGGTTGTPRAALGTHHGLLMSTMQLHAYGRTALDDWGYIITVVMPMFHDSLPRTMVGKVLRRALAKDETGKRRI